MSERSAEQAPWWLEGGNEICEFCQGASWIEIEVRCVACDRPGCLHCVTLVRASGEAFCRECAPERPERSRGAAGSEARD